MSGDLEIVITHPALAEVIARLLSLGMTEDSITNAFCIPEVAERFFKGTALFAVVDKGEEKKFYCLWKQKSK